jgi:hypothetical protein
VPDEAPFRLDVDSQAREWLDLHPQTEALVIEYEVHRCCGGGRICQVSVRAQSARDDPKDYARGRSVDGTEVLIDRRAAARLPHRFGLTVRGVGRWKHLDLQLDPGGWGDLLWA